MILLVVDGLRPDAITPAVMPVLSRLRDEGVTWRRSHAALPTVTRVNSATLGTGTLPSAHGIVSNVIFAPAVDSAAPINTADPRRLLRMGIAEGNRAGSPVPVRAMAERLATGGVRFVTVSAGSGGNALLNAPSAPNGTGVLVNHNLGFGGDVRDPSWRLAYPDSVSARVHARFGMPPGDSAGATLTALQDWSDRVARELVLPTLASGDSPAVLMLWTAEPDEAQHRFGAGSPEALRALRGVDRNLGALLDAAGSLGMHDALDVVVVSDHGFAWNETGVNVVDSLVAAGLKASAASADVVVASDGQSVQLHVRGHDAALTRRIAAWLHARSWVDVVFAPRRAPADGRLRCDEDRSEARGENAGRTVRGWIAGTVALELLALCHPGHAPDLFVTLPWSDRPNAFGVPGTQVVAVGGAQGAVSGNRGGHGGLSPWAVRNTMIAWGASFRRGLVVGDRPAGNVDVPRTVLALVGAVDTVGVAGRVLTEALRAPSRPTRLVTRAWEDTVRRPGGARVVVRRSAAGRHAYVDAAWRVR